nr:hypothetical protein [Bradyrhizobium sp.]
MFTFETTDQKEVRRFRIAQFNGRTATIRSGESTVTGHVRSVLEIKSSIPTMWTITIVLNEPKNQSRDVAADAPRPRLHGSSLLSGRSARGAGFAALPKNP